LLKVWGVCSLICTALGNSFSRFPLASADLASEIGAESNAASVEYVRCSNALSAFRADQTCQSFGTGWRLADITSTFENSLIAGRIGGTSWVGATDEENGGISGVEEGAFRWRDTAPMSFASWAGSQPDDGTGATHNAANANSHGQDCMTTTTGGAWDDLQCSSAQFFVCEGPSFCGNGAVAETETCDKGALLNGAPNSGCSATCTITPGYGCLLPGGAAVPAVPAAICPASTSSVTGSCCYLSAQAVVGDVRVVSSELEWTTVAESGTLGFYVSVQRGGEWVALHEGVLPSLASAGQGAVYRLRASGLRGKTIRIEEHELGGRSLVVYEGTPRVTNGAATLGGEVFAVTANALTGAPEMAVDAAPSAAGLRKAAGDEPTGVFALADGDGLLRVTFAEIAAELQVPVATVASRVAAGELSVLEHGNTVAWTRAAGEPDAIVFAARRRDSVYSATRPYEIRLSAGEQLVTVERSMDDVATSEAQLRFHHEVDAFAALAVSPDPTQEFWFERSVGNYSSLRDYTATFTLDNVDGEAATFDLSYYGSPGLSDASPLTLTMTINGQAAGTADVSTTGLGVARYTIPAGALLAGPNTVLVQATSTLPEGTAFVYVDAYQVTYSAPLEFDSEGRFEAVSDGALAFELDSAAGTPVWIVDATSGERISATRTAIDGTRARFTIDATANHEYFVATEAGLMEPAGLRARSEQHFADSSRAAAYVVIAPAALYDAATALVARRQTQGLTAAVVDVQDIYDAYGAGEHNPYAIREFLRVAQANWSTAPRYVLLLGDGNMDYRGVLPSGSGTIPPMMVRTDTGLYASDVSLTDTDADGRPNMAIGRVPAHTALEADAFVQRVVAYESGDLDAFERHALLVSGINRGADFTGYVNTLEGQLDSRVNAERIDRGQLTLADARTLLVDGINSGSFWFHYHGHGAMTQLDDDGLLTVSDVAALTNSNALTIMTGMSCSTARFEFPGIDSISELLMSGSPGGAIALFGASGAGRSHESGNIAEAFQRGLLTGNNLTHGRIGDVVHGLYDANTGAAATTEQLSVYLLLGDPATILPDRSRLAPPPVVVDPPEEDGGVTVPVRDGGGVVIPGVDSGRPIDPVTPPTGGLGGGSCSVSVANDTHGTSGGILFLLGLVTWAGRRARRHAR
jgi:MYXO-CTERM domain-containing protein